MVIVNGILGSIFGLILNISLLTGAGQTTQANMSVMVKDLTTGEVIETYREHHVVPPASVMKLLTTAAAMELYGPSFRFETAIEYTGHIDEQGTLHGDLIIRGGCDPSLGNLKSYQRCLWVWIRELKKAGIKKIDGSVVADQDLLDADAVNPAWIMEDVGNYYAPGIFALNYMDNTLNIVLRSGPIGTMADVLRTEPEYPNLQFINHIRCTHINYDGAFVHGLPYTNIRYLTGSVPSNEGQFGVKSDMPNPGYLVAYHLTQRLEEAGISVMSHPLGELTNEMRLRKAPRTLVYTHQSDSLGALIAETNINSNNLYAEAIFRYMGLQYGTPGTIHNSCEVLRDFWKRRGVSVTNALIKDGCGLAPQDAISAETFVQLLTYMSKSRNKDVFYASLPVSGVSGTLKPLLRGTVLEGKVHAKSGTIAGTKNYAGYIDLPNGHQWAFAILINSAAGKAKNIQYIIEKYLLDLYNTQLNVSQASK